MMIKKQVWFISFQQNFDINFILLGEMINALLRFFLTHQCITEEIVFIWYKNGGRYGYSGFEKARLCAKSFIDYLNTNQPWYSSFFSIKFSFSFTLHTFILCVKEKLYNYNDRQLFPIVHKIIFWILSSLHTIAWHIESMLVSMVIWDKTEQSLRSDRLRRRINVQMDRTVVLRDD